MTLPIPRQNRILMCLLAALIACAGWSFSTCSAGEDDPKETDGPVVKSKAEGKETAKPEKKTAVKNPFPKRVKAPELDGGVEWLNTSGEITLKDLRGKVVLLDFWTFCCINCMHVLPDLAYLEKKFDKELVVIGVHSAKFDNEKETGNIRKAILRYEIAHPVINDAQMTVWRKFGVNSWPTLVMLDPEGYYLGAISGEGNRDALEQVITRVVEYHKSKGTLDESPVQFDLERNKQPDGPLKFPGKVLADPKGDRLFISDSNHNRIVIATLDGKLVDVIGTGQIGATDGAYDAAQFDHPQGMCLVDNTLYVADTENHMLRTVDLEAKTVATLAGTGKQASLRTRGGKLRTTPLNSPWDVYALDGVLYIAMAGPHQIWSHKLGSAAIQTYAGSGREDIRNGSLEDSALAQPSGIASDGASLFVVDSEGSSVRQISTKKNNPLGDPIGRVETLVGTSELPNGQSLFAFGDVDGIGALARLQHPLGIVFHQGKLLVADSYNHKLKLIDPVNKSCETWLGVGKPGAELSPVQLAEPAGLTIAGETLFVADTNNHRILSVNLKTKQAQEFTISGLAPPKPAAEDSAVAATAEESLIEVSAKSLKPGEKISVVVRFDLPEDFKLNELAPVKFTVEVAGDQKLIAAETLGKRKSAKIQDGQAVFEVPLAAKSGEAVLKLSLSYGYCRNGSGGLCKIGTSAWKIPLNVSADADADTLTLTATPK